MSGEIFIEASEAGSFGLPVAEHLYLVFRDSNGAEYVLRSGPPSRYRLWGEMKIEVNVPMADSADDRDVDEADDRSSTPLDLPGLTDDQAWAIMVKYARAIEAADYAYSLLDENSNAFVGALLHAALLHDAGADPAGMLPDGVSSNDAVGFASWDEIVRDVLPPEDEIFRGTNGADRIAGLQIDEEIRGRGGDDVITAGRGHDLVRAGSGSDDVSGGEGKDRLLGGSGNDILRGDGGADILKGHRGDDLLEGGTGNDRLCGNSGDDDLRGGGGKDDLDGGPGNDLMQGGGGADRFAFSGAAEGEVDRVADFEPGTDMLRFPGGASFDQLSIRDRFEDGEAYAEVTWQGFSVHLSGVAAAALAEDTFAFV